jgi:hypothetical protein
VQFSVITFIYVALAIGVIVAALKKSSLDRARARILRYAEARGIAIHSLRWYPFAPPLDGPKKVPFRAVFSDGEHAKKRKLVIYVDQASGALDIQDFV